MLPENPANDQSQGDIVFELNAMADGVDLFPPERISQALIEAGEIITECRTLLEAQQNTAK